MFDQENKKGGGTMKRFKSIGVLLALVLTVTIPVGYVAATENDFNWGDDHHFDHFIIDPIKTDAGYISGTMIDAVPWDVLGTIELIGKIGEPVRVYRGIPYAAPPVGNLRWKPPQPVTPWSGIRECTVFSKWPAQMFPTIPRYGSIPDTGMSEDCLYLNVVTPAKKTTDRLPVMVWMHGGGTNQLSGSRPSYNLSVLPQHGVVLVTVSHRLGVMGYMAHPALTAESPNHASGNYGQLDLIAALQWVQKNIAVFGGNPHRVMIFGQSGGGTKVLGLLASPLAKGLFHGAAVEAGCAINKPLDTMSYSITLQAAEQVGVNLANKLGASTLAALRAKTWQEIVTASLAPGSGYSDKFVVDHWFLQDSLYTTFQKKRQNDVPFLIGAGDFETLKHEGIKLWASVLLSGKSNVYVYVFSHVPTGWRLEGCKAFHTMELGYQFGVYPVMIPVQYDTYGIQAGATSPDPGFDEIDDRVAEATMAIWTKFAATGNPNVKGLVTWPPFELGRDNYLDIVGGFSAPGFPILQVKPGYFSESFPSH
jgi:para-nitrobenzyl esterase